jgi:hypothetical protein
MAIDLLSNISEAANLQAAPSQRVIRASHRTAATSPLTSGAGSGLRIRNRNGERRRVRPVTARELRIRNVCAGTGP